MTEIEHPETKAVRDDGKTYLRRDPVIAELSAVRMAEEERKREAQKETQIKQENKEVKEVRKKEEEKKKIEIKRKEAAPQTKRQIAKQKEKELKEKQRREKEFINKESKKRAIKEKRDVKKIAEELKRRSDIRSMVGRKIVLGSRRQGKKLKLIKKLLNKIKVRMK